MAQRQGPKWANAERQTHLLRLWAKYGNRCLKGHTCCPNPTHYVHLRPKAVAVAEAIRLPCRDRQGNPIRDSKGNPLYLDTYKVKRAIDLDAEVLRLYDREAEEQIALWVAEDRAERQALREAEQRDLHRLLERGPIRGRFSAIGRDIFFGQQPQYYLDGLGISGLTFRPFAKIRLASGYIYLFVEIGQALEGVSKSRRRKAIRHGKPLPKEVQEGVDKACREAVRHYLTH